MRQPATALTCDHIRNREFSDVSLTARDSEGNAANAPRWLSRLLLSMLAWAAGIATILPASAESERAIYRCASAQGAVSYQDAPCKPEHRMTALYRFRPGSTDSAALARSRAIEQEMDLRNRSRVAAVRPQVAKTSAKPPSRCEAAKSKRAASLQRLGLKRDFDQMSALDRAVWDACQGL